MRPSASFTSIPPASRRWQKPNAPRSFRTQAIEADHDRVFGASTSRILEAGRRFTPYEVAHPEHEYEEHVIIKATHTIVDRSYETNGNEPEYRNSSKPHPRARALTPPSTDQRAHGSRGHR